MNKTAVVIAVMVVAGVVGFGMRSNDGGEPESKVRTQGATAGEAVMNTALSVSGLEVSALSGITEKLEGSCAGNKLGLSEAACIHAIRERKDICAQQTAKKYPGQLSGVSDVNRLQEVVSRYVDCLFQR